MAHFAQLDDNSIVTQVVVVSNVDLLDENGNEQESRGVEVCRKIYGADTTWVQTSYNNKFRKQYAGIGCRYDSTHDVFIAVQPYPSWVLDENLDWQPPVPEPTCTDHPHWWDEESLSWTQCPDPAD